MIIPVKGTALVGVLDVFFEEKGYINAEQFRRFCSPTVLLARIPKFVYANNETFHADIEVSHFGAAPLESAKQYIPLRINSEKYMLMELSAPITFPSEIFILWVV